MQQDTIIALATPGGIGAIGLIRLSGGEAIRMVNGVFHGADLERQASHTIHFGTIRQGSRILDEVLVSLFIAPRSYTKENTVEISCHGSPYIIRSIIDLLIKQGARAAGPGEFTQRAFLNGSLDLSQAEAVADLIASNSAAAHRVAMQQMRGGFSTRLQELRSQLIHFASMIELELDFAEEDVEFANRHELKALVSNLTSHISRLISSFEQGNVLKNGVPVVIAGKPNVGKSTLLNTLLNEERAIVSDIAGTTRDTIEDELNIEGIIFRFIDTAGIRHTADVIEARGVERTLEKMKQARLIIYLLDAAQSNEEIETQLAELGQMDTPFVALVNKADLLSPADRDRLARFDLQYISARQQEGIDELKQELLRRVHLDKLSGDEVLVSNIRHLEALRQTNDSLQRVLHGLDHPTTSDFLALDIRQALHHLGAITGQVTTDDLLENIFSKFCIGK